MSALAKMAVDMLLKEIPPETKQSIAEAWPVIQAAVSKENLDKLAVTANALVNFVSVELPLIKLQIEQINETLARMEQEQYIDNRNSTGKRAARNSGNAPA